MIVRPSFRLATALAVVTTAQLVPVSVSAQHDAWTVLKNQYVEDITLLESRFVDLAGAMEPAMYSWRPMDGVRSVSEEFMLIVAENYVIPGSWGATAPAGMTISNALFESLPNEVTTKSEVLDHLRRSFAYYKEAVSALSPDRLHAPIQFFGQERTVNEALFLITADMHEHLGKSITNARVNRIVPPWTARAQQRQSSN